MIDAKIIKTDNGLTKEDLKLILKKLSEDTVKAYRESLNLPTKYSRKIERNQRYFYAVLITKVRWNSNYSPSMWLNNEIKNQRIVVYETPKNHEYWGIITQNPYSCLLYTSTLPTILLV